MSGITTGFWLLLRLLRVTDALTIRPSRGGSYTPPPSDGLRVFFECPDCGYFHESVIQVACNYLPNRFLLGELPCGDETDTEVHYLDGTIERVSLPMVPIS
jgi:hypothetical protein